MSAAVLPASVPAVQATLSCVGGLTTWSTVGVVIVGATVSPAMAAAVTPETGDTALLALPAASFAMTTTLYVVAGVRPISVHERAPRTVNAGLSIGTGVVVDA